ncbi:MAG: lamin tail domain-containing protein [Bacteroidia bacterium]|nr:lamin tail domain-containing protein [Bacteroidia bacterium]MDW8089589.1 lamin tail domain-containing protein [Bacteroidia bacterium]
MPVVRWISGVVGLGVGWAQLAESFADGDFTHNPPWQGTTAYWTITPDQRLRSNGPTTNATLYLATASTLINDTEWEFWVRLAFNPSTQNFVRIYLVADQADLTDPNLNGYYLRLGGITGTQDSLELWRQQGSTHTRLAGGRRGRFGGNNNILRLRVLRSANGEWQAFSDSIGFWEPEFTVTDAVLTTAVYFGVYFQHTSSNRQNLWLDDFYIGPIRLDQEPPEPTSAEVLGPTEIRLTFSEPLEPTSATNAANYGLNPSIGISNVTHPLPNTVHLNLSVPLMPSVVYTLSYSNLRDLAGNSASGSLEIVLPEVPTLGDLLISELMPKPTPSVGLPSYEYVELYNRSAKWLALRGCRLCDAAGCATLSQGMIAPYTYLLLVPTAASASYPQALPLNSWPTLNDSGDSLYLWSPDETLLDFVPYRSSWYRDPSRAQGGWSLERIDLQNLCAQDSNWIASQDPQGGTPGARNSVENLWRDQTPPVLRAWSCLSPTLLQLDFNEALDTLFMGELTRYQWETSGPTISWAQALPQSVRLHLATPLAPATTYTLRLEARDCMGNSTTLRLSLGLPQPALRGEIRFSEVMAKPTPPVQLPPYEYIELYNASAKWIDLTGWQFCDATRCGEIARGVIPPGGYAVLVSAGGAAAFPEALTVTNFPTLNDGGDTLSLKAPDGTLMEELAYQTSWYRDPAKAQGGWSLERIDLTNPCAVDSNWIASQDPAGGTPGRANSVAGIWRDTTGPQLEVLRLRSATEILLRFSEPLDTLAMQQPSRYQLSPPLPLQRLEIWQQREVILYLDTPLHPDSLYELRLEALDCMGNRRLIRQTFGLPVPAAPYEVIFSEIMADPDPPVSLPPYEYLEIYNRSAHFIDLSGWRLRVGSVERNLPSYLLAPRTYLTLTSPEGALALSAYGPVLGISGFPLLSNRGAALRLLDAQGNVIESLVYSDRWYGESSKKEGGWSLERVRLDWLCGMAANWQPSQAAQGGTPSQPNSVATFLPPPPVQIQQIHYEPPEIVVRFSERVDTISLSQVENYHWTPELPLLAAIPLEAGEGVCLLPMHNPVENTRYLLRLTGLRTCAGAPLDTLSISLVIPAGVQKGDIILNEILPEPHTGGSRYVELYNISSKVLDLRDLLLARGEVPVSLQEVATVPVLLAPGAYVCLTPDTLDVQQRYLPPPSARFHQVRRLPAYDYQRDTVWLLRKADSLVLDRVPYAASYHFPELRSRKGIALERLSPTRPSDSPENWFSAASTHRFGTPGYPNSQREGSPTANEPVRLEPRTISPDGDGYEDLLWVYVQANQPNTRADIAIYTLSGYRVRWIAQGALLASGENAFRWEGMDENGRRLPAGIYLVVVSLTEPTRGESRTYRLPCGIAEKIY